MERVKESEREAAAHTHESRRGHQTVYYRNHPPGYREHLTRYEREQMQDRPYYVKLRLRITNEGEYIGRDVLGHIFPDRGDIGVLSPEHIDYRRDRVIPHEIEHFVDQGASDDTVDERAHMETRKSIRSQVRIERG